MKLFNHYCGDMGEWRKLAFRLTAALIIYFMYELLQESGSVALVYCAQCTITPRECKAELPLVK